MSKPTKANYVKQLKQAHKSYEFDVVGIQYRLTPPYQRRLAESAPVRLTLVREPDNSHDENAIAIQVADKDSFIHGMKIGFLRKKVAAVLAPAFDNNSLLCVWAELKDLDVENSVGTAEIWLDYEGKLALDNIS